MGVYKGEMNVSYIFYEKIEINYITPPTSLNY